MTLDELCEVYGIDKEVMSDHTISTLVNNFTYHSPNQKQAAKYSFIRGNAEALAVILCSLCPSSRELNVALTNLEQAVMWANAAISRNEKGE